MPIPANRIIRPPLVRNFGRFGDAVEVPNLTDVQTRSYDRFLQLDVPQDRRAGQVGRDRADPGAARTPVGTALLHHPGDGDGRSRQSTRSARTLRLHQHREATKPANPAGHHRRR